MQISWLLLCCTILQAAFYVDILVITLLHNIVGSVLCRQISWSLFCCTILQAVYYVDILVVSLLHNIVGSVLYRYIGHYFAAQYCRQHTMQISWLLLYCTILQAVFYVDILVITLLHNIVVSVLCRYLGHYFAAKYCRQCTMQISFSILCCTISLHDIVGSVLHCTILQAAYYVDILVITLLHNIVGSVLCRYLGHYFAAQYCRQRTMQISWSLLCCTILQAAYYVDILVITLLHNIVGSVLCRYLGRYFAAQYCRQRTKQIYVDILVITLLHNTVGSVLCRYLGHYFAAQYCRLYTMFISWSLLRCVLCRYLGHYFAAQYCRQRMQISWSLLCFTILQAANYIDTLLHNTVGSVLCRYLGHYFTAQYCRQRTMYYVDILVITLLHNIVCSVLCRYLGHYFAAQYCRQRTMQISWSLLCCTILQTEFQLDILVITLLHNTVGSVLCRYLGHYFAAQYCRQRTIHILVITLLHNIGSVVCRYLGHYFAAQYCIHNICRSLLCCTIMQISWSLLCCTILQTAYYVDILVITLLHNTVGSVLCRYLGHYFAAQYCRQRTMQISWSLLYCTILQAVYYVDILVIILLHNIVCSVHCRYLGHYFVAQYCRQRSMQISWSLLCCTILQTEFQLDILVITLLHNTVGSVLCRYLWSLILHNIVGSVQCRYCTLLHNIVDSVLCKYLGHYFAAQYCSLCKMQISWSLLCCTILQAVYYVDILFITLLHNIAVQYCRRRTIYISWSLLCCTILYAAYYVDILVITLLQYIVDSVLCRYLGHKFCCTIL